MSTVLESALSPDRRAQADAADLPIPAPRFACISASDADGKGNRDPQEAAKASFIAAVMSGRDDKLPVHDVTGTLHHPVSDFLSEPYGQQRALLASACRHAMAANPPVAATYLALFVDAMASQYASDNSECFR